MEAYRESEENKHKFFGIHVLKMRLMSAEVTTGRASTVKEVTAGRGRRNFVFMYGFQNVVRLCRIWCLRKQKGKIFKGEGPDL